MIVFNDRFFIKTYCFPTRINYRNMLSIYRFVDESVSSEINNVFFRKDRAFTVINDLSKGLDEIKAGFKKTVRYEVNKLLEQCVHVDVKNSPSESELSHLNEFYSSINMPKVTKWRVNKYGLKNIKTSSVYIDENLICFHVYVHTDKITRLLYSYCIKGKVISSGLDASFYNRYLHFKDMEYFKLLGCEYFDWGGISSKESLNGVDKFKIGFGGDIKASYSIYSPILSIIKAVNLI